ncbi:hypothetical protein M5K25_000068 [Dendrobium thyrsiflorum]|uniref:Uncharacterized protein n=1 Tax=Dendrobium thyrsiflorum TaxID=117978 RepID=A0ABD0W8P3_DENTH
MSTISSFTSRAKVLCSSLSISSPLKSKGESSEAWLGFKPSTVTPDPHDNLLSDMQRGGQIIQLPPLLDQAPVVLYKEKCTGPALQRIAATSAPRQQQDCMSWPHQPRWCHVSHAPACHGHIRRDPTGYGCHVLRVMDTSATTQQVMGPTSATSYMLWPHQPQPNKLWVTHQPRSCMAVPYQCHVSANPTWHYHVSTIAAGPPPDAGVPPDHHLRPDVLPDHHLRPDVLPDHHLRPDVLPDHRLRPNVLPDHRLRPNVLSDHRLRPDVLPDHRLRPDVLPNHHLGLNVQSAGGTDCTRAFPRVTSYKNEVNTPEARRFVGPPPEARRSAGPPREARRSVGPPLEARRSAGPPPEARHSAGPPPDAQRSAGPPPNIVPPPNHRLTPEFCRITN